MVEQRFRQVEQHLRSIERYRARALADGDTRQVARAERLLILLEEQMADLTGQLVGERSRPTDDDEETRTERQHIVVVNGDPDFLHIVRSLLQDARFNVTTTNFVPRTFAQIAALQPALLIVDLAVGERAGWDLLERLRAEASTHEIPVIIVSTDPRYLDCARDDTARYGGQRFLGKATDLDALLGVIDELIGTA